MNTKDPKQLLENLAQVTYSTAKENREKARPDGYVDYYIWKPTSLMPMYSISKETRPDFSQTFWDTIKDIENHEIFKDTTKALNTTYKECYNSLKGFVTAIVARAFSNADVNLSNIVKYFIRDLNGEKQEYRAIVKLDGLIIESPKIQLDNNTILRKPELNDLYLERTVEPRYPDDPLKKFTIFLDAKTYAKNQDEVHELIKHSITTFQLFKPGGVQGVDHNIETDSIINPIVSKTPISLGLASETYRYSITKKDEENLKSFWSNLKNVELPQLAKITRGNSADQLSMAYERYLNYFKSDLFEKGILYLVTGLEGLYLRPGETSELRYRLSLRAGKLLSLIGYNACEVSERLGVAYGIRSKYAHGYILKLNDDEFKKVRKYGDENEFSTIIADYLRASIVALLKRPSKDSLISKIDNSFLNADVDKEIKELLFSP